MMTSSKWKSRTFSAGSRRSDLLKEVDKALDAYSISPSARKLTELCTAVERWSASKITPTNKSGYRALLAGTRNKTSAVQELCEELRRLHAKPAFWPDATQGDSYIVQLNQSEVDMMRAARFDATRRSVMMIAAMNVDWVAFGFEQFDAVSSTAIDLGNTNYGSSWSDASGNRTNAGQQEYGTAAKIINIALDKAREKLGSDKRVEYTLKTFGIGTNIALGILKYQLFKTGVMAQVVPLLGPLKEAVNAIGTSGVAFRMAGKSKDRVEAAKKILDPGSNAADAIGAFNNLLTIEIVSTTANLSYRLLKDTALVVTSVLTLGAMTIVQVVSSLVELIVDFVYKLVYSLIFRSSVKQCREWVEAGAVPEDLNFKSWIALCPLLGAYFMVGLSAGGGSATALSMFSDLGTLSSNDFQAASTKLLAVRQSAAAYVQDSPVKVKWSGPNGKMFEWIDGLVKSDALSASVGLDSLKIHRWTLSEDADKWTRFKHKFHEHGGKAWSVAKAGWSVV